MSKSNTRFKDRVFRDRSEVPCAFCRKPLTYKSATVDHIVPRSAGGDDSSQNLQIVCRTCNELKGHTIGRKKARRAVEGFFLWKKLRGIK